MVNFTGFAGFTGLGGRLGGAGSSTTTGASLTAGAFFAAALVGFASALAAFFAGAFLAAAFLAGAFFVVFFAGAFFVAFFAGAFFAAFLAGAFFVTFFLAAIAVDLKIDLSAVDKPIRAAGPESLKPLPWACKPKFHQGETSSLTLRVSLRLNSSRPLLISRPYMDLSAVIEALVVASEEPLPTPELARLIRARVSEIEDEIGNPEDEGYDPEPHANIPLQQFSQTSEEDVIAAIAELNHQYEVTGRAFVLMERVKGWKIYTRPEYAGFARQLSPGHKPRKLSGPALETLAIIAYRQPVTKAAIEAVRGVSCDGMLQKLLDLELIKIGGRADLPGRPLLYQSTDYFFEHFGIKNIDELPNAAELRYVPLPQPDEAEAVKEGEDEPEEEQQLPLAEPADTPPVKETEEPEPDFATAETEEQPQEQA